jgi:putative DNA primase/helicase
MTDWSAKPFYKAFIPMVSPKNDHDKHPIGEYKDTTENYCTLEQAQQWSNYMGILAPNAVLLDADDEVNSALFEQVIVGEELRCLMSDRGRGVHALFFDDEALIQKCGTGKKLACGIVVDIKAGRKNGLECLRFKKQERKIVYDINDDEQYQQIPKYLTPVTSNVDFAALGEGDGRNQALFNYILTLQANDFDIEESRTCIRIINKYVLKVPLSDSELEIVLRDAAFAKPVFFKGSKLLHDRLAEFLKNNRHIITINGQLHIYENGVYVPGVKQIKDAIVEQVQGTTEHQRREVLSYLPHISKERIPASFDLIAFRNGVYNITNDSFSPHTPEHIITNLIPWDYNPNAYSELADVTLNKIACNDPKIRALLDECIGSTFYRSNTLGGGKCFIFTGMGNNGKSSYIESIQYLLGEDNIVSVGLKEFTDNRFKTPELVGKLADLGDDISSEYIPDSATFKKLVRGERVSVEKKGQDPFEFNSYAKLIFSANEMPRMRDGTGAIKKRLIAIPFNALFSETDKDWNPNIKYDLKTQSVMEYLIVIGIQGLKRVLQNKQYTKSEIVELELNQFELENNPLLAFCEEYLDAGNKFEYEPTNTAFEAYSLFCMHNNFKPFTSTKFSKEIGRRFNLKPKNKRIKGEVCKCFIPVEDSS